MSTALGAQTREFRQDINGLRAWAVIAVVLYHFGVAGIGGGFVGVDVFFVISGYLMCGIIVRGQESGSFGLWRFYLARARRIWPALIVLCIAALICGWFFLMPEEYRQLGRHARESLTFGSNLRYFEESGYFDVASQEKWLLHTWSLSVEWQFYLLLPLLIMLFWRLCPSRRGLTVLLTLLLAGSLAWCIWRTQVDPSEAFYTLQSRAWEMLAGALVFLAGPMLWSAGVRRAVELLGFILIVGSICFLDSSDQWPGWRALLPVSGAVLVLLAARDRSAWTASLPAQWLGTRSYSIYLWHWPLVVALAYLEQLSSPLWVACAIVASLVLGHWSYAWVEVPSQRWLSASTRRGAIVLVLMLVLVAVFAQQVRREGFPQRLPDEIALIEAERDNHNPRIKECFDPAKSCVYGEEPVKAILLGDSHADAVVTALQAALPNAEGGVLFRGGSGCPIVFGLKNKESREYCEALNTQLEAEHADFPAGVPVVVVGRTSEYIVGGKPSATKPLFHFGTPRAAIDQQYINEFAAHYVDTLCALAEHRPVYVARPTPEMAVDVPTQQGRAKLLGQDKRFTLSLQDYRQRHDFVWALQDQAAQRCGVQVLDPLPYLCADGECVSEENGRPLYRDHDHLSEFGNRRLVPMFQEVFGSAADGL